MATINTPTGGNGENNTKIQELMGKKKNEISETLFGDKEAILKDLKENHVKIEENVEFMGYKGKKIHIDLPSVGSFKGFKFDCFVSENDLEIVEFENNLELGNQSCSMKDIGRFLESLRKYMEEYGINLDTNMDYYKDLRGRETNNLGCETGDCLKNIIDLKKSSYFLKDKEGNDLRAERKFNYDSDWNNTLCFFEYEDKKYYYRKANLLLKLSD